MNNTSQSSTEDRRTSISYGSPYLEYYRGIFDCAYVCLHPFVYIPGIDPASFIPKSLKPDSEPLSLEMVNKIAAEWREIHAMDPAITVNLEKQQGQAIRWETVREACGFQSIKDVNRALLSSILALRDKYIDHSVAAEVRSYCKANKIFLPNEDFIQTIMEHQLACLLKELGKEWTVLSDRDGGVQSSFKTDLLVEEKRAWQFADIFRTLISLMYPADNSLLIFVPYDTFTTIICGQHDVLHQLKLERRFEGFWANSETDDSWWLV